MRFADVERAAIPTAAMARLAPLRDRSGLEIALSGKHLWLRWHESDDSISQAVFAIPGARLFTSKDGQWHEPDRSLPTFDMPESLSFRPIAAVIAPASLASIASADFAPLAMPLELVADATYRPTLALVCPLGDFASWARSVPPSGLRKLRAARCDGRLFVLGKSLPWIDGGERFWGRSVLVPIGYRPRPDLGEESLRTLVGVADSDVLVVRPDGIELVPQDAIAPLSHASLRLAEREAAT
jgi:hypothetical protein